MSARELDVFGVPYRPIVVVAEPTIEDEAYWLAISNSLIRGTRDAVLVDTSLLAEDAQRLAAWIRATEKNQTTVSITHGHGDHFIGLMTGSTPGARTPPVRMVETAEQALDSISRCCKRINQTGN